jgi:hypothetical protein
MSVTMVAMFAVTAGIIALIGTWYAWRDYHRHPDRYGYRPGERERQFTGPERGITREPIHRWSSSDSYTLDPGTGAPRLPTR